MHHVRQMRASLQKLTGYGYFTRPERNALLAKLYAAECKLKEVARG